MQKRQLYPNHFDLGIYLLLIVAALLLLPLVAMQFTDEVHWTILDFIVAGGLLLTAGFTIEWLLRRISRPSTRLLLIVGVLLLLLLVWAGLAVG